MSIASLYPSINPSLLLDFANVKRLDPRITFTRTTTATYYDGVTTAKAEQNLLTYSQEFDNASWTKDNVTVTANSATVAPDGTTTADLFYPSSTGTWRLIAKFGIKANIQYTLTVYAKASGFSNFFVGFDNQTTTVAWFNLTTGVKGTKGSSITSSDMTSVGNGWYRCQVVFTHTSDSFALFGVADADNSSTATASGTNGALIWGAQAEQRSSATAYTATTSQAITNYIPVLQTASSGQARFDHNPTTGESLGLLIEEARTNLVTYSAQFDNAAWTKSGGSITLNGNVAPDGTVSADIFVENTSNSTHELGQAFTINMTSTAYTMSIYVKANGRTRGSIFMVAPGPTYQQFGCNFNLTAQTATVSSANGGVASSATITPVGNDWYRITATGYTTYNGSQTFAFYLQDSSGNVVYTGNGFSGMSVWGAQLEAGSFATSYIPTVASSVTRNADAASMTGTNFSSWFNNGEGTVYSEAITGPNSTSTDSDGDSIGVLCISDGTNNNRIRHALGITTLDIRYSGSQVVSISSGTYVSRTAYRSASAYKTNDFQFSNNGTLGTADTSGNVPPATTMQIGASGITSDAGSLASGSIKKIAYYPIRVTNAQLQALTV